MTVLFVIWAWLTLAGLAALMYYYCSREARDDISPPSAVSVVCLTEPVNVCPEHGSESSLKVMIHPEMATDGKPVITLAWHCTVNIYPHRWWWTQ